MALPASRGHANGEPSDELSLFPSMMVCCYEKSDYVRSCFRGHVGRRVVGSDGRHPFISTANLTSGTTFPHQRGGALLVGEGQPGDQIDRGINPTQNPSFNGVISQLIGPARPASSFHESDFWAQGLNLGVVIRF
jgi:hypothetical protein